MSKPTFKPGDLVERTGESVLLDGFDLIKGMNYPVADTDERGFLIFDGCDEASFNPRGFRLVEGE